MIDIKSLRQETVDLKGEANEILAAWGDSGEIEDETKGRLDTLQARLSTIDEMKAAYEVFRQEELGASAVAESVAEFVEDDKQLAGTPVKLPEVYANLGEQLKDIYNQGVTGAMSPKMGELHAAAEGAGEAIGSDGGFLIQPSFSSEIVRKMHDIGSLLNMVRTIPISGNELKIRTIKETDRATGSRWGAVQGYWVDEGGTITPSRPKFGRISLSLKKIVALGYATEEELEDAPAISAIFTEAFAEELLFMTEDTIFNGTGAGQPAGLLGAAATVSQAKASGQDAATVTTKNLSLMWSRLYARSKANAAWFINTDVEPELDFLTIPVGTGGLEPRFVTYGPDGILRIKGRPVITTEYNATLGTVGDIILADLNQYLMITKGGVKQDTSIHVRFTTDEMAFRATFRTDGQSLWEAPLTPFKGGSTKTTSPFVTLATRS